MDLLKKILETKINCFVFNEPKSTILFVKQRKPSNNVSDKISSARAIAIVVMASTRIRGISERFPRTHLKPHFAHYRAFQNIFEQNE